MIIRVTQEILDKAKAEQRCAIEIALQQATGHYIVHACEDYLWYISDGMYHCVTPLEVKFYFKVKFEFEMPFSFEVKFKKGHYDYQSHTGPYISRN